MSWLFYALLSQALYTTSNFVDKYVLEREIRDYRGMPIYTAIMGFVFGVLLWIVGGFPLLSARDALLVILTGVLVVWTSPLYFKVLSDEDTSQIIVLYQMTPVLVLVLSFIFLQEHISPEQLLGFVLILGAAVGVSLKQGEGSVWLSRAFWLVFLACLMVAVSAVLFKFVVDANTFVEVMAYGNWGLGLGGLILYLLFPGIRGPFNQSLRTVRKTALGIIFFNQGLFVLAKFVQFLAISLGPVSLVSVVGSTQTFFGILAGWLLTAMAPAAFHEDVRAATLLKKGLFGLMMFVGVWLVY